MLALELLVERNYSFMIYLSENQSLAQQYRHSNFIAYDVTPWKQKGAPACWGSNEALSRAPSPSMQPVNCQPMYAIPPGISARALAPTGSQRSFSTAHARSATVNLTPNMASWLVVMKMMTLMHNKVYCWKQQQHSNFINLLMNHHKIIMLTKYNTHMTIMCKHIMLIFKNFLMLPKVKNLIFDLNITQIFRTLEVNCHIQFYVNNI